MHLAVVCGEHGPLSGPRGLSLFPGCAAAASSWSLESRGAVPAGLCGSCGQGPGTPSPLGLGRWAWRGKGSDPPRFNRPGSPHRLGSILPATKKAVPGNEPSLPWPARAARLGRSPGAVSCLWPCVGPAASLVLPAPPESGRRCRARDLSRPGVKLRLS